MTKQEIRNKLKEELSLILKCEYHESMRRFRADEFLISYLSDLQYQIYELSSKGILEKDSSAKINTNITCPDCGGSGYSKHSSCGSDCHTCEGSGVVKQ